MSILIKGMEMPKPDESVVIVISNENGVTIAGEDEYCGADYPAVIVPTPHGRLVDLDDVNRIIENLRDRNADNEDMAFALNWAGETIKKLPTIIEAEEGNNG